MLRALPALLLAGCVSSTPRVTALPAAPDAGPCACTWGPPRATGTLQDGALVELSGLAASRRSPPVLWAHNDSGDVARFFALGPHGEALGRFVLDGGTAVDWEDVAVGPCPQGSCVYLGDIGDNQRSRDGYAVYRVPEPAVDGGTLEVPWERFAFTCPQGERHNAETLLVHPLTGRVYVVTKAPDGERSQAYRFPEPLDATRVAVLVKLADLKVPAPGDRPLTGGDINPCGTAVLLRFYNRLVELHLTPGADFDSVFAAEPVQVPAADEGQGEAVAYAADGRSYFTSSEKLAGPVPLNQVGCR